MSWLEYMYAQAMCTYRMVVLGSLILLVRSEIDACDYDDGILHVEDTDEWRPTACPSVQVRCAGAVIEQGIDPLKKQL